ncbi:MAG: HAMP domain-containing protein [Deltaproteobacteria bacterium]|nr:HAMP domain-containing protein [Deltaproteobacteria bacterium]
MAIRNKLLIFNLSIIIILVGLFSFMGRDFYRIANLTAQEQSIHVKINNAILSLRENAEIPLAAKDSKTLEELLQSFIGDPDLLAIGLFDNDGKLMASLGNINAYVKFLSSAKSGTKVFIDDETLGARLDIGVQGIILGSTMAIYTLERVKTAQQHFVMFSIVIAIAAFMTILLSIIIGRTIVRPIYELTRITSNIVDRGDWSQEINIRGHDEIGVLAASFAKMVMMLQRFRQTLNELTLGITKVSERVLAIARKVDEGSTLLQSRVIETANTTTEMLDSLHTVAKSVEVLQGNAENSATANSQMVTVNQKVSTRVQEMESSVNLTMRAVEQLTESIVQIANSIDHLNVSLAETSSTIVEMDASIAQVGDNAGETSSLAHAVSNHAQNGVVALAATLEGVDRVKLSSQSVSVAFENLDKQIGNVGAMLDVINQIADQTNLLALNAAIIAASAGEHGRGFAVVAEEIKVLAMNTRNKTQDIATVVQDIKSKSSDAKSSIDISLQEVDNAVRLGLQTSDALGLISSSADKATSMVRQIADASLEQTKSSRLITTATQRIVKSVEEISSRSREQSQRSIEIHDIAERMRNVALQVQKAIIEQMHGSEQIGDSVNSITDMVKHLNDSERLQTSGADRVLQSVNGIRQVADSQRSAASELHQTVDSLNKQAEVLHKAVRAFRA